MEELYRKRVDVVEMLNSGKLIKICAPMVRYSKLPFRLTVRDYGADICYTPMIMADSFIHSAIARDLEFQSCAVDTPIVVQFAAGTEAEFSRAVELVAPYADGVDLNCGCPQGWAISEGIGAGLMKNPDLVANMLKSAKAVAGATPISAKIRVYEDSRQTVELARRLEVAGAAYITVHGRTRHQRSSEPVNYEMIRLIQESVHIPVIANGDIDSLAAAKDVALRTGVQGVMAARALLENPALFAGYVCTPWECIDRFIRYSMEYGTTGHVLHHHLTKMTGSLLDAADHRLLTTSLSNASVPTLLEFIDEMRIKYHMNIKDDCTL